MNVRRRTVGVLFFAASVATAWAVGAAQEPRAPVRATIADLGWLAGQWRGGAGPAVVEEHWTAPAGGTMFAVSRTIKGDRTAAFEFLRIIERDGGLIYVAQPNGRPPTEFTLTGNANRSATFENPRHDFPNVIRYALRADGALEATVGDGHRAESYHFTRQ